MEIILADTHGPILGKAQGSPNLALLYLASYARERLPDLQFHYIPQKYDLEHHLALVERHKPRFYAISFTSYGLDKAFELMRAVRQKDPSVTILAGGSHATPKYRQCLLEGGADIVVLGEGEETFCELLRHADDLPAARAQIAGIAYLDQGEVRTTGQRPLIEDLDTIPFPARDLIDMDDYVGIVLRKATPNTEMIITRGCPLRCVFCANPVFRVEGGPTVRMRSAANIAAEAEALYQQGYREIYMHSDELNVSLPWSIEVCKALAALGHRDLYFQVNLRVLPISEEFVYWMKQANFWLVHFGIESASQRVLDGIKKKMPTEKTLEACRMVSEGGIHVFGFFTMYQFWEGPDGQLQMESDAEVLSTVRMAAKLWWRGYLQHMSWVPALPVQGSEMFEIALRHGIVAPDYVPNDDWNPVGHLPGVTERGFRRNYLLGRWLQVAMVLRDGRVNWKNWRGLLRKVKNLFFLR